MSRHVNEKFQKVNPEFDTKLKLILGMKSTEVLNSRHVVLTGVTGHS